MFLFPYIGVMLVTVSASNTYTVDPSESILSIVTHKAGLAAFLAHNHLIYPSKYTAEAVADPDNPEQANFKLQFQVTDLVVDDRTAKQRWFPRINATGLLNDPFPEVSEKDRASVRESMLSDKQLDSAKFPQMTAELKGLRKQDGKRGQTHFNYELTLALTAHGKTVERPFLANIDIKGDTVNIEAVGTYKFTDFGIKPFSAFAGAVRNQDPFDVYVNITAKRATQ